MAFVFIVSDQGERVHVVVSGQVQGVYFRAATQRAAEKLRLSGWVRNQPDGAVEVMAEGPRAALEGLIAYLHRGPPAARVSAVAVEWLPASGQFSGFEVQW